MTSQALKSQLDFDLKDILSLNDNELIKFLKEDKKFDNENLEKLAEILFIISYESNSENRITLLEKALTIYDFVDKVSTTYSLERITKIEKIKKII